jgi:histidinol-phosphate aminotransferase
MPTPTSRDVLASMPVYKPGRVALDEAHKLSSNELPFPPLPSVLQRLGGELNRINRYPDAGNTALVERLAQALGQPPEAFAASTGSVAVLYSLLSAYCSPGDEVVYAWRSFEAYPIAVGLAGARSVGVPLTADGRHDLDALAAAVTDRTKVVMVCTPNNPTGPVVEHDALVAFVDALPPHVLVVVDEAYVEFVRDPAAARGLDVLAGRPNVVVLRTFSKAYGLAGLRVGYAVAHPDVAQEVRKAIAPFSVSGVAQAAAIASLDAADELAERVDAVVAERTRLRDALLEAGFDVPPAEGNFVWLPLGDDALDFAEAVAPVSVRPFAGDGVRVSVGLPEADDHFLGLATAWRSRH